MTEIATEAGHWYLPDGSPFYTVTMKDGRVRDATLRDARKVGAAPSVTSIIRASGVPWGLMSYFENQILSAAAQTPRDPYEGEQAWMDRVYARSKEHSETARDAGTAIHGCIEGYLCGESLDIEYADHVTAAIEALEEWCGTTAFNVERSFYHPLGYGGKCDVHVKPAIDMEGSHAGFVADFKTKDFTEFNLPKAYDNHFMQLAAYREGLEMPSARCAIVFVSTSVPGLAHLVEIPEDDLQRGWGMFRALLQFWQIAKKYSPCLEAIAA